MSTAESGTEQDFKTQLIYPAGEGKKVLLKRPPYICQTVWRHREVAMYKVTTAENLDLPHPLPVAFHI